MASRADRCWSILGTHYTFTSCLLPPMESQILGEEPSANAYYSNWHIILLNHVWGKCSFSSIFPQLLTKFREKEFFF